MLFKLRHPNIVQFVGIFSDSLNRYIVCEFMTKGSVLKTLRDEKPPLKILLNMILDASKGMRYLENAGIVHRDVSARNLLCDDLYRVKVSDFGMSRLIQSEQYKVKAESKIPVRWSAPEIFNGGSFSSKSDCWSFGVTCWEIFEYGVEPYVEMSNMEVINYVREGKRLTKPNQCPEAFFTILMSCWNSEAEKRPSFVQILNEVKDIIRNHFVDPKLIDSVSLDGVEGDPEYYSYTPSQL